MNAASSTPRRLAPVPVSVLAVCVAASVANLVLLVLTSDYRATAPEGAPAGTEAGLALVALAVVGALVASRQPKNPLGWLFLLTGVVFTVGPFAEVYAMAVTEHGTMLPLREYAGWIAHVILQNPAIFGIFAIILMLFPDGASASRRTHRYVRAIAVSVAVFTLTSATRPGTLAEIHPTTPNPFAIELMAVPWRLMDPALPLLFLVGCVSAVVSLVARFRRADGVLRQQLKWLLVGAGTFVVATLSGPLLLWPNESLETAWTIVFILGVLAIPITAGFAMLRYRLFELDRIVSRTASYALVLGVLVLAYTASILVLSAALRPVTGSGDLPVALSTLVVAAAFRPVQRRVRGVVEGRFNRRRYDAQLALAGFGQSLRSELDGNQIAGSVRQLVGSTFEPHHVGLWLPTAPPPH